MEATALRVAPLSGADRKRLSSGHPELRGTESALVISGSESAVSVIEEFAQSVARDARQSERVLEVLTEEIGAGVLDESRVLQLQRLAEARRRFLQEFPTLTSQEIAEVNRSRASNTAALANGWKAAGRVFAVSVARGDLYPAFQFGEEGKPLPVIAQVLEVMRGEQPWTIALWFAGGSGWLGGKRPVDLLHTDPEAVVEAARRTKAPLSL
jgi:hypothetical protein